MAGNTVSSRRESARPISGSAGIEAAAVSSIAVSPSIHTVFHDFIGTGSDSGADAAKSCAAGPDAAMTSANAGAAIIVASKARPRPGQYTYKLAARPFAAGIDQRRFDRGRILLIRPGASPTPCRFDGDGITTTTAPFDRTPSCLW